MDLRCELCKNKCCIYLPEVSQTERKGRMDRRESARRPGLRNLGLVQKTGRINVHLVVHTDEKSVRLQEENQLIVLQYEHLWRPQAKIRESIK